jgi:hypothetical protein
MLPSSGSRSPPLARYCPTDPGDTCSIGQALRQVALVESQRTFRAHCSAASSVPRRAPDLPWQLDLNEVGSKFCFRKRVRGRLRSDRCAAMHERAHTGLLREGRVLEDGMHARELGH